MRIFVAGYKGHLGSELINQGCSIFPCNDITEKEEIENAVSLSNLSLDDVLINCAAFTSVDKCESEQFMKQACSVNTRGVENLRSVSGRKWRLFHLSTDYVFDGKSGPYSEKNRGFDPVNAYGCTKYGGEVVIATSRNPGDCVIRTTGLYGSEQKNDFASLIVNALQQGSEVKVTEELRGNQTYVHHLAEALIQLASIPTEQVPPIIHLASLEVVSRYDFARMIAKTFDLNSKLLIPVRNRDIPGWVAKRPTKGGLKVELAQKIGLSIYSIQQGLDEYKEQYD